MVYLISIIFTNTIGFLSGFFTADKIETWYAALEKPVFQPPNWVFGPVWTILYTLIGVALARLYVAEPNQQRTIALGLFAFQLVLNTAWTPVFFGAENLGLALVIIGGLVLSIIALLIYAYRVDPIAMYLLIPYFLWVCFATALNASIWQLN